MTTYRDPAEDEVAKLWEMRKRAFLDHGAGSPEETEARRMHEGAGKRVAEAKRFRESIQSGQPRDTKAKRGKK